MLKSMTGYGSAETSSARTTYKVEIKALNGKFLELNLRMPKAFNDKEMQLRNLMSSKLIRGTVNVFINVEKIKEAEAAPISINHALAAEYYKEWSKLAKELGAETKDILYAVMQIPDIMKLEDNAYDEEEWKQLLLAVNRAFEGVEKFREEEGKELKKLLCKHCDCIIALIPEIEAYELERIDITRQRLIKSLNDLVNKENFDKNRFEQELVYYLEKLDITEEKDRLKAHCTHFLESMEEEQNGRKLNFISQEIGREINTLGAKANHAAMQKAVVKMKEELEKIKEQVLNVL